MIFGSEKRCKILLLFAVCFLSACSAENRSTAEINQKTPKEQQIAEFNRSVFCLSVTVPNREHPSRVAVGTGFLVSENLLATAYHVSNDLDKDAEKYVSPKAQIIAWKKFDDGGVIQIPLKIAAFDEVSDMALYVFEPEDLKLQAKTREIKFLPLADRLPDIGENILSVAYYGAKEFPFNSLGSVSMIDNGEDIYSDITLMPGNSGSPLISMKTGEVLGLNVKAMTMGDGTLRLGISRKISELKKLIEKTKN